MTHRLYLIARSDIADMGPGKMSAQAAHAQAEFDYFANTNVDFQNTLKQEYWDWKDEAGAFGTTIVLSGTEDFIFLLDNSYNDVSNPTGLVVDPTYPWKNYYGELFLTSEITFGWAFVNIEDGNRVYAKLQELKLHV